MRILVTLVIKNIIVFFKEDLITDTIDKCINNVYTDTRWGELMKAKIQKWGNSDGLRIPKAILSELNIKTNDEVDISINNNQIIITKPKKTRLSLEERFKIYDNLPQEEKAQKEYVDFGCDVGKESW